MCFTFVTSGRTSKHVYSTASAKAQWSSTNRSVDGKRRGRLDRGGEGKGKGGKSEKERGKEGERKREEEEARVNGRNVQAPHEIPI